MFAVNKFKYPFLFFLIFSNLVLAQRKPKPDDYNYFYEIQSDDPVNDNFTLRVGLMPFIANVNTSNFGIGWEVAASLNIKSKYLLDIDIYRAYIDQASAQSDGGDTYFQQGVAMGFDAHPAVAFNAKVGYRLNKRTLRTEETIKVRVGSSGRYTYVLLVKPVTKFKGVYVTAGYGLYNGTVSASYGSFTGVRVDDPSENERSFTGTNDFTMLNMHYLTVGAAFVKRHIVKLDVRRSYRDGKPKKMNRIKRSAREMKYYADLMIPVSTTMANMTFIDDNNDRDTPAGAQTYELDPYTSLLPIGIKLGALNTDMFRRIGLSYGAELGIAPGRPGTSGAFLKMRVGVSIGAF